MKAATLWANAQYQLRAKWRIREQGQSEHSLIFSACRRVNANELLPDYGEAIVYRHEYARYLTGWPKAVLATSQPTLGEPRREDDVVAVARDRLADSEIIGGISHLAHPGAPSSMLRRGLRWLVSRRSPPSEG